MPITQGFLTDKNGDLSLQIIPNKLLATWANYERCTMSMPSRKRFRKMCRDTGSSLSAKDDLEEDADGAESPSVDAGAA